MSKTKGIIKDKPEKKRSKDSKSAKMAKEEVPEPRSDAGQAEIGKTCMAESPGRPSKGPEAGGQEGRSVRSDKDGGRTKKKGSKNGKKVRSGCWTADMIEESIQGLERRLNEESEKLSKSKRRRIMTRLSKLKRGLRGEVEIGGQLQKSIKTIKREMKQKSMNSSISVRKNSNMVCLCCRKKGHQMSDCRYYKRADADPEDGGKAGGTACEDACGKEPFKCFLCGKMGHTLKDCKEPRNDNSVLPFASCFRCGKAGHIVAFCPSNESGSIYPRGGSCNICGSVKHLARNCDQQISKSNKNKRQSKGGVASKDPGIMDPDLMWKEAMQ
ncbi:hypothetical protein OJ253_3241 [Cryptosporidium canis]|uniref:CCHC-type domain-containing protein n=1 Tax=Cryptosporidium canis TaxID=195482 RepID=A0A9D5DE78_9CRYT|nr:hypothetical protein OJ253_3241 [Cryptosporidium canis]